MAKDPAFLFYPGDFNTGTQFFTDEQVGKYMRLLMAQHQHGHLSEEQVIFICKSYDKHIMNKFKKDSAGLWFNERLEIEITKRKNFVLSRSKNKEGKTKQKIISKSYVPHMENENINEDIIEINRVDSVTDFINISSKIIGQKIYRIWGVDGLKQFYQMHMSAIPYPEHAAKFMQRNKGKPFEDFKHVFNSFNKFVEKQYQ